MITRALSLAAVFSLALGVRPVSAQWVASVYLGDASTAATTVRLDAPELSTRLSLEPVPFVDASWQSPVYYGGRLTRFLRGTPWLGGEAEFIHMKAIADTAVIVRMQGSDGGTAVDEPRRVSAVLPRLSLSHGLNFVLANVVVRVPLRPGTPRSRVSLLARAGAGPTIPHVEATIRNGSADGYQWGRVGFHAAVGAEVFIAKRIALCVEAKRTTTRQVAQIGTARLTAAFTTRHLMAGMTYRLQSR